MSLTLCDTLTLMGLKFKELLEDAAGGHKMIHYIKGLLEDESHRKVKKAHKERLLTDCLSCVVYLVHRLLLIPILRTATDTHRDGGRQIEREREIQPQIHTEMEAGK